MSGTWRWDRGGEVAEAHVLLCASDAFQAAATGTPVPRRSPTTTAAHLDAGHTWLPRHDGVAVATFTLTATPPCDLSATGFPAASRPRYPQRLAVLPDVVASGSLAGLRCLRKAVDVAEGDGADVLRAEANPDLADTLELLRLSRFRQCGDVHRDGSGRRWVYPRNDLTAGR